MTKKILITGSNGQLGKCLQKLSPEYQWDYEFLFLDSTQLDITNINAVFNYFEEYMPDFCINAAAYTAVDLAEQNTDKAFAVNKTGAANLAEACAEHQATLIHISTDYVFDGNTEITYDEESFTNPQNVYGISKLQGEEAALELNLKTVIIRTSWLYSEFNKNFVKAMLNLFQTKKELNVVNDQFGQPTNANDLAEAIMKMINSAKINFGIFHYSNYPETSWYHFAQKIAEYSGSETVIKPISTEQFPTPAKRPVRSSFSLDKIEEHYSIDIEHWENSLEGCIAELQRS